MYKCSYAALGSTVSLVRHLTQLSKEFNLTGIASLIINLYAIEV